MVVDVEEVELLLLQYQDERVDQFVELADVVDVGPEKGPADGLDASWQAEEPTVLALPRQRWRTRMQPRQRDTECQVSRCTA